MSFLHPDRLCLLIGVAGLIVAYVVLQRRRQAAIARYTNPALLSSIAPNQQGWRRHLPSGLAIIGLLAIVGAIAQPTRPERVARNEGVVVVAVDVSASMRSTDVSPTRIDAAISGAVSFVGSVPPGIEVGLVAFDGGARLLVSPTTDRATVLAAITGLQTGPGTAAGEAIYTSLDAIKASLSPATTSTASATGKQLPAAIVLLSDGVTTVGRPVEGAAKAAADAHVPISTIAFGTPNGTVTVEGQRIPVPADPATMSRVAKISGGNFFEAASSGQLHDVYRTIQLDVAYTTQQREITRALLGVALIALVGATLLAMGSTARAV
ncbi:MAG: Ca-activated chloride channel [Acidimicrobiaceae bacterium]|jgi:Ca-activated chloride channel family protein